MMLKCYENFLDFFIKQIELLNNDSKKFSNEGIIRILNSEKKEDLVI